MRGNDKAEKKHRFTGEELGEPSGQSCHRKNSDTERKAAEDLNHAQLGSDLVLRTSIPGRSTRDTTSVDIASATTSWITVPTTISIAPRM